MTNLTVQRQPSSEVTVASPREAIGPVGFWRDMLRWDPFREVLRWDPFAHMLPALSEREPLAFAPDFDVKETKDAFIFKADLPGVESRDIEVQATDHRLTISGRRSAEKEEKAETTYRCERAFGAFTRAFTLPAGGDLDKVAAELKNGVLSVTVPKKPEAKTKQISVKSA
jgi:HSP20 family protein